MIFKGLALLFYFAVTAFPVTFNALVLRVVDGDTLHVQTFNKNRQKIRLFGIDAPELQQRDGAASGRYLAARVGGKSVQVVPMGDDDYGRVIAMVYDEFGQNMNKELVRLGLAWVYRVYVEDENWVMLEQQAKQQRIGLWRRPSPIPRGNFDERIGKKIFLNWLV